MEFDKTLLAGSTGMMVLKLLEQEDMYGYQMIAQPVGARVRPQGRDALSPAARARAERPHHRAG